MKRYIALILCFALIFSFAACLKKDKSAATDGQSVTAETESLTQEITGDTYTSAEEPLSETTETEPSETVTQSTAEESLTSAKEKETIKTGKAATASKETTAPKTTVAKAKTTSATATAAAKTTAVQTATAKPAQTRTTRPERSTRTPVSAPAASSITSASTTRPRGGIPQTGPAVTNPAPTNPPHTNPSTTTTQKAKTVTLIIDCSNAVKYKDKTGKDVTIPPNTNGIILRTEVELEDGDTVMSVLKRAAKDRGIDIASTFDYVKGIGGLREKNCGGSSGWLYSVNGVYPNVGAEQYEISAGDVIKWEYTVEQGDTGYKM